LSVNLCPKQDLSHESTKDFLEKPLFRVFVFSWQIAFLE